MCRIDQGDSYIMHLPDGTTRMTGYTAEGWFDEDEFTARLRGIYAQWLSTQNQE